MTAALLSLLALYVVYTVALNLATGGERSGKTLIIGGVMHLPIIALASIAAARQGVFSRQLVSPVGIGVGLALGHLIFGVSLLISDRSFRDAAWHFIDLPALWRYGVDEPGVLGRFVGLSVSEEIVYRAGAQSALLALSWPAPLAIGVVAVCFSAVHKHFFKNPFLVSAEFLGFAFIIGFLYYWTGSLILVIVIHAVRNIEIAYLEEIIKEQGDKEDGPQDQELTHQGMDEQLGTT